MRRLAFIAGLLAVCMGLSAYSDIVYKLSVGYGPEFRDYAYPEILYRGDVNIERMRFFNDLPVGYSLDLSVYFPSHYSVSNRYSEPFNSFKQAVNLSFSPKIAFRFLDCLYYAAGPDIEISLLNVRETSTLIIHMLFGIDQSFVYDLRINSGFGVMFGLNTLISFYQIDFMGESRIIEPRFYIAPFIGFSIHLSDGFSIQR